MSQARFAALPVLAAAGLAGTLALTGCAGSGQPGGARAAGHAGLSPARAAPHAPAASSSSPAIASQATLPAQPAAAGPHACGTGMLRVSVGPANGAAGSSYYPVLFTNISAAPCTLYGYPGVALVTRPGGGLVGAPAVRNPTFPGQVVTLAPGAVAHASLQVAVAANYPAAQCRPVTARWLQVYPPGQYGARYVAFTAQTCTGRVGDGSTLGIYVVRPGATGP